MMDGLTLRRRHELFQTSHTCSHMGGRILASAAGGVDAHPGVLSVADNMPGGAFFTSSLVPLNVKRYIHQQTVLSTFVGQNIASAFQTL
eukprot:472050-Amphidinium_carterae.1